jgi:microcystin-dependent protein
MSEPFLSEIRILSFAYAPRGWAQCNGQFLPINQNQALFSLLGTTFGGNGQTTFQLPNLQGRVPIHVGRGHTNGEVGGEEAHTLSVAEMPTHLHPIRGVAAPASLNVAGGAMLAQRAGAYAPAANLTALAALEISNVGSSQAHANMQPFLALNFCIALQGIFPSRN